MSLNNSFSNHKRKVDILDVKRRLRERDPLRRREVGLVGLDIGFGIFTRGYAVRPPSVPNPPTTPPSHGIR